MDGNDARMFIRQILSELDESEDVNKASESIATTMIGLHAKAALEHPEAANYVGFSIIGNYLPDGEVHVTYRRAGGRSPEALNADFRALLTRMVSVLKCGPDWPGDRAPIIEKANELLGRDE